MPELPEVECVRRGILEEFLGQRVKSVWSRDTGHLLEANSLALKKIAGMRLQGVERRGKFLLWRMERFQFLVHLGMTGVWSVSSPRQKHTRLELVFEDGRTLSYTDPRQFGSLCLLDSTQELLRWTSLGPDAIDDSFSPNYLLVATRNSKVEAKVWLMDQKRVAGIGNIYASEALFRAHVHPKRPANSLSENECRLIVRETKKVMNLSIKNRGTTFSDYRQTNGRGGSFQNFLRVFQKSGQPCPTCGKSIEQIVQGGRSTFFCSHCQK
jgi:formamidopyrimidine-DNA glycosylase